MSKTPVTRAIRAAAALALLILAPQALAQATVPWSDPSWKDFGTTTITDVAGNFLPGWTTLTGTPDLGQNVFFVPTTSLSGAPDDAALWMLEFDPSSPSFPSNESVELSLSGFTPGSAYALNFFASIVLNTFAGWKSPLDALNIDLIGADISTYSTSLLSDAVDADGLNAWAPQSIAFTAMAPVVKFRFNVSPTAIDPDLVGRFGIDGCDVRLVPSPGTPAVLMLAGAAIRRRQRRR